MGYGLTLPLQPSTHLGAACLTGGGSLHRCGDQGVLPGQELLGVTGRGVPTHSSAPSPRCTVEAGHCNTWLPIDFLSEEENPMSWETRGQHTYYYRVERATNGHLVKHYFGAGPAAQRAAQVDHQQRTQRDTERRERHTWDALDTQVTTLDRLMTLLSQTLLVDGGWYRHKRGEWRTRRNNGKHFTAISPEP